MNTFCEVVFIRRYAVCGGLELFLSLLSWVGIMQIEIYWIETCKCKYVCEHAIEVYFLMHCFA